MKNKIKKYFRELIELPSASGNEQLVIEYMYHHLKEFTPKISVSPMGNLRAELTGNKIGPHLMLSAHADEVGFIVKNILNNGFITFERIGGIHKSMIPGRNVIIGKDINGVIGVRPAHLDQYTDNSKSLSYIDVGAFSKNEVQQMGINIGDRIVYEPQYRELSGGDVICSKSVDDKISLAIILVLFEKLARKEFCGTVTAGISVQEEFSLKGAKCLATEVSPDYSIILDTIPAGDTPDINTEVELPVFIGKGPACPMADGFGSGIHCTMVNRKVQDFIKKIAAEENINLQDLTIIEDSYLTDASEIAYAGNGIPVGMVTIPRRYSHSPVEVFHIKDAEDSLKLVEGIINQQESLDLRFIQA